jgi:hypothetical protein
MLIDESAIISQEIQKDRFRRAPRQRELLVLVGISFVVMWTTILVLHGSTALVLQWGDNGAYHDVANAIRHWDFRNVQLQHFMGYPYLIAAFSLLFHVPTGFALWFLAVVCSFISVWLTARMFGTLTAGYFAFANLEWLQLSYLGGVGTGGDGAGAWQLAGISPESTVASRAAWLGGSDSATFDDFRTGRNRARPAVPQEIPRISARTCDWGWDWDLIRGAACALLWRPSADFAHVHDT